MSIMQPSIILRENQEPSVVGLRNAFASGYRRPILAAPCGFGKTVLFSYLTWRVSQSGKSVILMCHRDFLIEQISNTLTRFGVKHGFITADSRWSKHNRVHVASAATLVRRLGKVPKPDYLIADECHHATMATGMGRVIREFDTRTVGATATPWRLSGEPLGDIFDFIVLGPTPSELIEWGRTHPGEGLSPYKLYAPPMKANIDDVKIRAGDLAKDELDVVMDTRTVVGDAVKHYRRICDGVPALGFTVSVKAAEHAAEQFRAEGYRAMAIHGNMDRGLLRNIRRDFEQGQIHVLMSCELVSEGYDMPHLVAGIMLRPTLSLSMDIQQKMRTMRSLVGKECAYILDHAGNTARHGLPDDDHEWTLAGRASKKNGDAEKTVSARTCEYCFAVSPVWLSACRECHRPFPINAREVEHVDGELKEIDVAAARAAAMEAKNVLKFDRMNERASAKTLEDLVKIGQARGYKPGWAEHVYAARTRK